MPCDEGCRTAVFGKTERTVGWEGNGDPVMSGLLRHCIRGNPQRTDRPCLTPLTHSFTLDVVALCAGDVEAPMAALRQVLGRLELRLNETKPRVVDAREESFDFLGFSFHLRRSRHSGKRYPHVEPSRRSVQRINDRAKALTDRRRTPVPMPYIIGELNRTLRGWSNYFTIVTALGSCPRSRCMSRSGCASICDGATSWSAVRRRTSDSPVG